MTSALFPRASLRLPHILRLPLPLRPPPPLRTHLRRASTAPHPAVPSHAPCTTYSAPSLPETLQSTYIATVALVGAPNAGKSSLSNALVRNRVSAVSRKLHTTRDAITAALTCADRQLVIWDTPGLVERAFMPSLGPERRAICSAAWGAAIDADVATFVVDTSRDFAYWRHYANVANQLCALREAAAGLGGRADSAGTGHGSAEHEQEEEDKEKEGQEKEGEDREDREGNNPVGNQHAASEQPHCVLVLNKVDVTKPKTRILEAAAFFRHAINDFDARFGTRIFNTSAYNGRGVDELRHELLSLAHPGEFQVPPDATHFEDDIDLVRQHLWEKLLHRVHQEVPYRCHFENDGFEDLADGGLAICEVIRVPSKAAASMVIGRKGEVIQWIREEAEKSIGQALGRRVKLKLVVAERKKSRR